MFRRVGSSVFSSRVPVYGIPDHPWLGCENKDDGETEES